MNKILTTKEIQWLIGREQVMKGHNPVAENVHIFCEHDVMSMSKSGYLYEFEVKISRSDFKADAKKTHKHQCYSLPVESFSPNYFYYVCPKDMIKENELPAYAGLIYVAGKRLQVIKQAPRLHKHKYDKVKLLEKICRSYAARHFLGSAMLTYKNKQIQAMETEREKTLSESNKQSESLFSQL